MPDIKLFIATTIDGFIAREGGSLDWLEEMPNPEGLDYGYGDFIADIDVVVMGRTTYEEILGFGVDWPYTNCDSFVVTSDKNYKVKTDKTEVLNCIDITIIDKIKSNSKKNIWIIGGGKLISEFINLSLVDEMTLSLIPIILGKGIKLFTNNPSESNFQLLDVKSFNTGIVNLRYKKK